MHDAGRAMTVADGDSRTGRDRCRRRCSSWKTTRACAACSTRCCRPRATASRPPATASPGCTRQRRSRPAVILLDLVMPDLGGLRVLQEMHANPTLAGVPVLVLTGRLEAIPALEDRLGRDRVFSKPFGVADLLSRIAELTGKAPTT